MSAAGPDDRASHNTVDSFPDDPERAWEQVLRYRKEYERSKTYLTALNVQVIGRHYERVRPKPTRPQLQLATVGGERTHGFD